MQEIYNKLQEINNKLKEAQLGVSGIIQESGVPDSTKHLDAVLKHTEEAATGIMNAASKIRAIVNESSASAKDQEEVNAYVTSIYEHCTFQDISGQRVKKVMKTLKTVEQISSELLASLGGQLTKTAPKEVDLMEGPQLPENAASQDDIDKLFSSAQGQ